MRQAKAKKIVPIIGAMLLVAGFVVVSDVGQWWNVGTVRSQQAPIAPEYYRVRSIPTGLAEVSSNGFQLALDQNNLPMMLYTGRQRAGESVFPLNLIHCGTLDCSTKTNVSIVDNTSSVPDYNNPSSALAVGADGFPIVLYADYAAPGPNADGKGGKLRFIKCNTASCESKTNSEIATGSVLPRAVSNILIDNGLPIFIYQPGAEPERPRLVRCGNTACSTKQEYLLDNEVVYGPTSLIRGWNGFPAYAYTIIGRVTRAGQQFSQYQFRVVQCQDQNCTQRKTALFNIQDEALYTVVIAGGTPPKLIQRPNGLPLVAVYKDDLIKESIGLNACSRTNCTSDDTNQDSTLGLYGTSVDSVAPNAARTTIGLGSDASNLPVLTMVVDENNERKIRVIKCGDERCGATVPTNTSTNTLTIEPVGSRSNTSHRLVVRPNGFPLMAHVPSENNPTSLVLIECLNAACGIMAPAAPVLTEATAGNQRVTLTWTRPSDPVDFYQIQRTQAQFAVDGSESGGLETILINNIQSTTYTDTGLLNRPLNSAWGLDDWRQPYGYVYTVRAFNAAGGSLLSNSLQANPSPGFDFVLGDPTPSSLTLREGEEATVQMSVDVSERTNQNVSISASDAPAAGLAALTTTTNITSVQANGATPFTLTIRAPVRSTGPHVVTVRSTSSSGSPLAQSKTIAVTVLEGAVVSIAIEPRIVSLAPGSATSQQQFVVKATGQSGTERTLSATDVTWSLETSIPRTSGQTVAHFNTETPGLLVADNPGRVSVRVTLKADTTKTDSAQVTVESQAAAGFSGQYAVETTYIPALSPAVTCQTPNAVAGVNNEQVRMTWCNGTLSPIGVCQSVPATEANQQQYRWQYRLTEVGGVGAPIAMSAGFTQPSSIGPLQREVVYVGNLALQHPYEWSVHIQNQAGEESRWSTCLFTTGGKPDLRVSRGVGSGTHIIVRPDALRPTTETIIDGQSLTQVLSRQLSGATNPMIIGMPMEVEVGIENAGTEDASGYWVDLYGTQPTSATHTTDWLTARNSAAVFGPHRSGQVVSTNAPIRFKASNLATELDTVLFADEVGGVKKLWAYADASPTLPTLNNGKGAVVESDEANNAGVVDVTALEKFKFAFTVEYAPVGSTTFAPVPPRISVNQGDTVQLKVKISSDVSKFKPASGLPTMQLPRPISLAVAAAPSNTVINATPGAPVLATVSQTTGADEKIITIQTFKCPLTQPNCSTATPSGLSFISITGQTSLPQWDQFVAPSVPVTLDIKLITASDLVVTACEAKIGSQSNESTVTATAKTIVVNKGTEVQLSMTVKNKGMVPTNGSSAVSMTRDAPEPGLGGVNATQLGTANTSDPLEVGATQVFSSFTMPTSALQERTYPIYAQVDINNIQVEQAESNNVGIDGRQQPCGYVVVTAASAPTATPAYYLQFTHSWPWGLIKQLFWGSTEIGLFPDQVVTDVTGPTSESTNYQLRQQGIVSAQTDKLPPSSTNTWKAQLSDEQIEQDTGGQIQAFCLKDASGRWSVSTDGIPKSILDKNDDQIANQRSAVTIPPGERLSVARSLGRFGGPLGMIAESSTVPLRNELFFVEQQSTAVLPQTITIANDLPGAFAWAISAPAKPDWFTLSATSGTTPSNGVTTISVGIPNEATSANPQTRTYEFAVTHGIAGNNACTTSIPVRVTYTITPIDPNVTFTVNPEVTLNNCRVVRDGAGRMTIKAPAEGFQVVSITSQSRGGTALHYQPQLLREDESAASDLFEFVDVANPATRSSSLPRRQISVQGAAGTQKIGIRIKDNLPGRIADYTAKLKIATNANLPGGVTELSGDAKDVALSCNINTTPTFRNVTPSPKNPGSACSSVPLLSTMNRPGRKVYSSATPKQPTFFWDFNDTDQDARGASETQGAFKVMIKDCSTNTVVFDPVIPGAATSCVYGGSCSAAGTTAPTLKWNTVYDWYLQVQDSRTGNTASSGELDPALTSNGGFAYAGSFLTDPHHPPEVDFTWKGEKTKTFVLAGSEVAFLADQETPASDRHRVMCYTDFAPDTAKQCYDARTLDADLHPTYEWFFGDNEGPDILQADVAVTLADGTITSTRGKRGKRCQIDPATPDSDCAHPKHNYKDIGLYTISLRVDDGVVPKSTSNYFQKPIKVISPLFKRELPQ